MLESRCLFPGLGGAGGEMFKRAIKGAQIFPLIKRRVCGLCFSIKEIEDICRILKL